MKETPSPNAARKAYSYLVVTVVLLFILAFTWAIDNTIGYVLGGIILYTSFLTVYRWPRKSQPEDRWRYQQDERNPHKPSSTSIQPLPKPKSAGTSPPDFKTLFETFTKQKPQKGKASAGEKINPQKISKAGCFLFAFGFVVLAIVLNLVFNDDPEDFDDMSFENQYAQAENYYNTGDYVQAIIHYKYALVKEPNNTNASLGLGNAFAGLNNIDSALYYYRSSLALDPSFDVARYNIGWVHYKNKNYVEATRELKLLIDRNPSYLDAFQLQGDIYYDQQLFDDALRQYERAYTNGQRNFWLSYVTGYLYQRTGNTQIAINRYKEALTYDSSELDIYKRLGELMPGDEGARYRAKGEGKQW